MRPAAILTLVVVALAVAAGTFAPRAVPAAGVPIVYVALGDSDASGHGLGDTGPPCRQSPRAYPPKVRALLRARHAAVQFRQLACSGATAASELHDQVTAALATIGARRALVSITMGINDSHWSEPAAYEWLRDPDEGAFEAWVDGIAARVGAVVRSEVGRLLRRPGIAVVVTDYPNPANPESILFTAFSLCADVSTCYSRSEYLVHQLNRALANAIAGRARARFASIHEAFRKHPAPSPECGSAPAPVADTWIQYPSDPDSNSFPPVRLGLGEGWRGDCAHPNDAGTTAYAHAVDAAARLLGR